MNIIAILFISIILFSYTHIYWQKVCVISELSILKEQFERNYYLTNALLEYGKFYYQKHYTKDIFLNFSIYKISVPNLLNSSNKKEAREVYDGELIFENRETVINIKAILLFNNQQIYTLTNNLKK